MAKIDLKFLCVTSEEDFIKCKLATYGNDGDLIFIKIFSEGNEASVFLDKSTAIKFAKTLRTEINKMTESEVYNA